MWIDKDLHLDDALDLYYQWQERQIKNLKRRIKWYKTRIKNLEKETKRITASTMEKF